MSINTYNNAPEENPAEITAVLKEQYLARMNDEVQNVPAESIPWVTRKTPPSIWDGLTPLQQVQIIRRRWAGIISRNEVSLGTDDYLQMAYPDLEITPEVREVLYRFLTLAQVEEKNPTTDALIRYIVQIVSAREPIRMVMSQCIGKEDVVREGKLNFFLKGELGRNISQFSTELEAKGWSKLKMLIDGLGYPVQITLMLGDMDTFTLDGCREWCSPQSIQQFEQEMCRLQGDVQIAVDDAFGAGIVTVERWSSYYRLADFMIYLEEAQQAFQEALRAGKNPKEERLRRLRVIMKQGTMPYFKYWGYDRLAPRFGVSRDAMCDFVQNDIIRTAAQYRLEAKIVEREGAVQVWAESCGNKYWPMNISNYDSAGIPPSISLL